MINPYALQITSEKSTRVTILKWNISMLRTFYEKYKYDEKMQNRISGSKSTYSKVTKTFHLTGFVQNIWQMYRLGS